jgi:hypothetical protein
MTPGTEQRVGAIVRQELALFWEDLGQHFQKLGAGFRSALEKFDSALQSHDRKHQELQQFLRRLALGRRWVGDHEVSDGAANRHAFGDVGCADLGHEDGLAHSSSPSLCFDSVSVGEQPAPDAGEPMYCAGMNAGDYRGARRASSPPVS